MANDRIHIRCRNCGRVRTLAKYYPTIGSGVWEPQVLADWIDQHIQCSPNFGREDLNGDRCFDLMVESEEGFVFPEEEMAKRREERDGRSKTEKNCHRCD